MIPVLVVFPMVCGWDATGVGLLVLFLVVSWWFGWVDF